MARKVGGSSMASWFKLKGVRWSWPRLVLARGELSSRYASMQVL